MRATKHLPAIDDCIELYLTAHETFGDEPFDSDQLARDLPSGSVPEPRCLTVRLDLLVAYGLFEPTDDGRYRVRCTPDESLDRWRNRYVDWGERLYRQITERSGDDNDDLERIAHEGEAYRGVRVPDGTSLDSVAASVAERSPGAKGDAAGVVLRSSPEFADRVQRMADDLTDPSGAGGDLPARYEKEGTDLVGDHKDSLEFRLFLRRA